MTIIAPVVRTMIQIHDFQALTFKLCFQGLASGRNVRASRPLMESQVRLVNTSRMSPIALQSCQDDAACADNQPKARICGANRSLVAGFPLQSETRNWLVIRLIEQERAPRAPPWQRSQHQSFQTVTAAGLSRSATG